MSCVQRFLKIGYVLALACAVFVLSRPAPVRAQRTIAYMFLPGAGVNSAAMAALAANSTALHSYNQAQQQLMQAQQPLDPFGVGMSGGMGLFGNTGTGMGGGMGGGNAGMMGMGGGMRGGGGMMGMGGGMMGMGGMRGGGGMMGMGGGFGGGNRGFGGMGGGGFGGVGGMGGFAGKGFGGFNGKKAL